MMKHRMRYVIAYDIPDDRRRNRVAKLLEGHGERVQYSLFECQLTAAQFKKLWQELGKRTDEDEDSLRAYRLCSGCAAWARTRGPAVRVVEVPEVFVV
jgi:CRISPR-associated protein Cas2